MRVLNDILSIIKPCAIKNVMVGTFTTAVVSRRCGLASTMREPCSPDTNKKVSNLGHLTNMKVNELSEYILSDNHLEASIGMAAINSSINVDEDKFTEINAADIIQKRGENKNVAIIGNFPFIKRLKDKVKNLYVFEKKMSADFYTEDMMPDILPKIDILAISGTTLINHTFDEIMGFCNPNAFKIMLGPSTPLTSILFDYGIDALSGAYVEDESLALTYLSQGAVFRQIEGIKYVTLIKG